MKRCHVYTTNSPHPILIMGYISHNIGRRWTVIRGAFYTHYIKTDIIYDISITEEGVINEKA